MLAEVFGRDADLGSVWGAGGGFGYDIDLGAGAGLEPPGDRAEELEEFPDEREGADEELPDDIHSSSSSTAARSAASSSLFVKKGEKP